MRISDWSSDVCSSDLLNELLDEHFNRTRDLLPVFLAEPGEVNGGAACLGSRGLRQPALVEIVRLIEDEIASVQGRIVLTECRLQEGLVERLTPVYARTEDGRVGKESSRTC